MSLNRTFYGIEINEHLDELWQAGTRLNRTFYGIEILQRRAPSGIWCSLNRTFYGIEMLKSFIKII